MRLDVIDWFLKSTILVYYHCSQKLSLSPLYFNKTLWHKSSEWSSLLSVSGLKSPPPEAKNPVSHCSATTFHLGGSSGILQDKLSKGQELIHGYIALESRGGTLTRTKWCHFMFLLSMLWLSMFQMGLIIYVSLLLLTPEILSLPFDPQDNAFLSWAHSYAAFHNWSNCWVCGALPTSSVEGFPWWTSPLQGKGLSWGLQIPSTIACDASS